MTRCYITVSCSVQSLGETIPLLMKKLDKLQNHTTHTPNISENINRIRQLIQQARNAASKVTKYTCPHAQTCNHTASHASHC